MEMYAVSKKGIEKTRVAHLEPNPRFVLTKPERENLQSWLSIRYRRQALPNALDARLKPALKKIELLGKKYSSEIIRIYVQFDPDEELSSDKNYEFSLFIVYDSLHAEGEKAAEGMRAELEAFFKATYYTQKQWRGIELINCSIYADDEFTLASINATHPLVLEHISLRDARSN